MILGLTMHNPRETKPLFCNTTKRGDEGYHPYEIQNMPPIGYYSNKVPTSTAFGFYDVIMKCALTKVKNFDFLTKLKGKII